MYNFFFQYDLNDYLSLISWECVRDRLSILNQTINQNVWIDQKEKMETKRNKKTY